MTVKTEGSATTRGAALRVVLAVTVALAVSAVMTLIYVVAPDPSGLRWSIILVEVTLFVVVYVGLTVLLFMRVKTRDQLTFIGITVLTSLLTFFVLSFAWLYRQIEIASPGTFNEPISKMSAVYFTIAVLSTVGFGDIRPLDDIGRAAVTAQMILGVGLLATAIGLVTQSTRHVTRTPEVLANPNSPEDLAEDSHTDERERSGG